MGGVFVQPLTLGVGFAILCHMIVKLTDNYLQKRSAAAVPGSWYDTTDRTWKFDASINPAATRIAIKLFPELLSVLPDEFTRVPEVDFRPTEVATTWAEGRTTEELLPLTPAAIRDVLRRYQTVDIAFSVARMKSSGGAYLGWDRGLGKTVAAITTMYELDVDRVIVVTPNNSKLATWFPQIELWDKDNRFRGRIYNLAGAKAQRERIIKKWESTGGILLAHYEVMRLLDRPLNTDLLVVDESHRLAKGSSGRDAPKFYKALRKTKSKYRLCLSGSIIINSPEDLFGALHLLFPKSYSSKWRDWNDRFIQYAEGPFGKIMLGLRPETLDHMRAELANFLLVRSKDDELDDLPERLEETLYVTLSDTQRKVYNEVAENFLAELPDGEILTTPTVLAQLTKLRQIATGLDLLSDEFSDSAKLDLTEELVADISPSKVVIFTWHKRTAYALGERLKKYGECAIITGDVKMEERAEYVRQFQEEASPKIIIATIKTLGESVTLHAASDVIFVESSWTPADMEQAADRVRRIGQHKRVTVYNIVAKDTVDETKILPALKSKDMLRRLVLGK